jgi:putative membrane protein
MLPQGFLGTRADILMDIVVVSLLLILPALAISWSWARGKRYAQHRNLMTGLGSTLAVVVTLFEVDMRLSGGIFEMTAGSAFAGTLVMNVSIWGHTFLAIGTSILWAWLIIASWLRFPRPPEPAEFSDRHRFWGRIGLVAMSLTGITGVQLYVMGFMF